MEIEDGRGLAGCCEDVGVAVRKWADRVRVGVGGDRVRSSQVGLGRSRPGGRRLPLLPTQLVQAAHHQPHHNNQQHHNGSVIKEVVAVGSRVDLRWLMGVLRVPPHFWA